MIDAFYTPQDLAQALLAILPIRPGDTVIEPSVGGGAWIRALKQVHPWTRRIGIDLDEAAPGLHLGPELLDEGLIGDFTRWKPKAWTARPHWVIGNPPYSDDLDLAHVQHGLRIVRNHGSVAMLLPVGFLAGRGRWNALHRNIRPRAIVHLPFRVRFGGPDDKGMAGKRDTVFIWWDLGWSGPTLTAWVDPSTMTVVGLAQAPTQGVPHGRA